MRDPIQVHENHAGPIRQQSIILPDGRVILGSLHFNFVAYRDAERDANFYGYGSTHEEAIADYLRQICEEQCSGCDTACLTADDCCLATANFTTLLKRELASAEASATSTHAEWRDLNKEA